MNQVAVIETDAVVTTMNRARAALAEAKTIQDTKRIVDAAAAAEIYARRQKLGEEASDLALSIKVEALRKLGEMLQTTPKATGAKGIGKSAVPKENRTLADLGLTKKESAVAQKLAAMPEDAYQQVRDGHVTVAKAIAAVDSAKASPADEASDDDGPSVAELLDQMQDDVRSAEARASEFERVAMADDGKAEAAKLVRRLEQSDRAKADAMATAAQMQQRAEFYGKQLARCGKAVGVKDLDKVAPAVEAMARAARKEVA